MNGWHCVCQLGWRGAGCDTSMETACGDGKDNDGGKTPISAVLYFLFIESKNNGMGRGL